jgi:hypothetical protein
MNSGELEPLLHVQEDGFYEVGDYDAEESVPIVLGLRAGALECS